MIYKHIKNNEILHNTYNVIKSAHINKNYVNNKEVSIFKLHSQENDEFFLNYTSSLNHLFYSENAIYKHFINYDNIVKIENIKNVNELILINISNKLYKEKIIPNTFYISLGGKYITDDGNNNLLYNNIYVGNIFYEFGVIVINNNDYIFNADDFEYLGYEYSNTYYEIDVFIYIKNDEFNFSNNETFLKKFNQLKSTNNSEIIDNFTTYFSTIGLYNENDDLIAIAKMAYPIKVSKKNNIIVKITLRITD